MRKRYTPAGIKGLCSVSLALIWLISGMAEVSAHIAHRGNAYADIELSPYKDEIVYTSKLGLIASLDSGDVFRPADPLARAEFAVWVAAFNGLAGADGDAAAAAALDAGLIGSLKGTTTYGDINQALFAGGLTLEGDAYPARQEVTREQYAAFVTANASVLVDGKRLEERAGFTEGPAGIVKTQADQSAKFGYVFVIGEAAWTMSDHPRVVHAPGDPALWDGQMLTASWINAAGEVELLDFRLSAGVADASAMARKTDQTTIAEEAERTVSADHTSGAHSHMSAAEHATEAQTAANGNKPAITSFKASSLMSYWPLLLTAIVFALAAIMFARDRRRKSGM